MSGRALAEGKNPEVKEIAVKYGVERYLNTEKLAIVDVLVQTWAEDVNEADSLTRSTKWLESKSEIEDIMANIALENNSRESMYLLGQVATGKVSFEEVKNAYINGWNTLMRQYANAVGSMSQEELVDLERYRERFLSSIPMSGSIDEKRMATSSATQSLQQIELMLQKTAEKEFTNSIRIMLGEMETTRTMILSQAQAGFKSGALTPMDYQQVQNLIGRGNSLIEGQLSAMNQYGNQKPALIDEMNRTLTRANDVLGRQEHRYAMAGLGFVTEPKMNELKKVRGRMGSTGDGLHIVTTENRILNTIPVIVGESVREGHGAPQWVAAQNVPPQPTIVANQNVSQMKFMNPADVHRTKSMESKFSAYHKQKLQSGGPHRTPPKGQKPFYGSVSPAVQAKVGNGLGGLGASVDKIVNPWVQFGVGVAAVLALPRIIEAIKKPGKKADKADAKDDAREVLAQTLMQDPTGLDRSGVDYQQIYDRWVRKIPKDER